jgi:hypothetical protein
MSDESLLDDLSDVELRVRLSQRSVPSDVARRMVDHRDAPDVRRELIELLAFDR